MPKAFDVLRTFVAKNAISGRERMFNKSEIIIASPERAGPTVAIEVDSTFFVVERSIFDASCKVTKVTEGGELF
jgi:hypothetical protein